MTKSVAIACVAAVALFAVGFMQSQPLDAKQQRANASQGVGSMGTVGAMPARARQFGPQKANADQSGPSVKF